MVQATQPIEAISKVNDIVMDQNGSYKIVKSTPEIFDYLPDQPLTGRARFVIIGALNSLYRSAPQKTLSLLRSTKDRSRLIVLSRGGMGLDESIHAELQEADWMICTLAELSEVFGRPVPIQAVHDALDLLGWKHCIVTLGADGYILHLDQLRQHGKVDKIIVTNTVGAGDTFAEGFLAAMLATKDPEKAAQYGVKCARSFLLTQLVQS